MKDSPNRGGAGAVGGEGVLLKSKDAPAYVREDSIDTGYRSCLSYQGCIKSMFRIHNETVNIWTHLLGFLYFSWLLVQNILQSQPHIRYTNDRTAVILQLLSYQACMMFSTLFHTFLCHSEKTKLSWQEADHAGILLALWGTYTRVIVTNFSCFPVSLCCHLALVTSLFGTVFYVKYSARINGGTGKKVELPLFLALALYAVAPIAHWVVLSPQLAHNTLTSQMILWMVFPYLLGGIGLFFYISRIPERIVMAGTVDLCGASHQIWHVLIFSGMVSWYELTCWLSSARPLTCQLKQEFSTLDNFTFAQES